MADPILWYFADPMCSWCWGFTPVFEQIKEGYNEKCRLALVMGGLRPGTSEPVTDQFREEILHHWREVNKMTGQTFRFDNAMPNGFVYDTEPASRAVLTVGSLKAEMIFSYFKSVQAAFYTQNRDVTKIDTLMELAQEFDVGDDDFSEIFYSDESRRKVQLHFMQTREFGVRGFPTLIMQDEKGYQAMTRGYATYEKISQQIDSWLSNNC